VPAVGGFLIPGADELVNRRLGLFPPVQTSRSPKLAAIPEQSNRVAAGEPVALSCCFIATNPPSRSQPLPMQQAFAAWRF